MENSMGSLGSLVGSTPEMAFVYRQIRLAAASDDNVLVYGDTGTGKELVAREIHMHSARADKPFIAVNCSAIPQDLCASELFGHIKGAFSGAFRDKKGKFELAEGGTLFLDEIGTMRPEHQAILLRVIDNKCYERVGSNATRNVSCRIIAASNRNLMRSMEDKVFRSDLYYRLDECYIHLPQLKNRIKDVPLLAEHFIKMIADDEGATPKKVSNEARALLLRHNWPGNVRELQNTLKKAYRNCANGTLMVADFAFGSGILLPKGSALQRADGSDKEVIVIEHYPGDPNRTLQEVEREHIVRVMKAVDGNRVQAAGVLGIERKSLYNKMKRLGIDPDFVVV